MTEPNIDECYNWCNIHEYSHVKSD